MPRFNWFEKSNRTIPKRYHILFWGVFFVFNVIRWGSYFDDYWYSLKSNLVEFPLHIALVYFNIYYLIPKLILSKKIRRYILMLIIALIIIYIVRTGLNWLLVTKNIWPEAIGEQKAFSFDHIVAVTIGELYVVSLATAIKLTVDWIYERRRVEKWRKATIKSELNFLKSQIQPHFFFNTLNNLYALTLEKSDAAPSVVLKLSDIMQYVLYDVREQYIRLYDEINYIQNYLDLERLRYGNRIQANTHIIGAVDDIEVPPLLFLPFIENCFKHGSTMEEDIIEIDITFEIMKNKILKFRVSNTFNPANEIPVSRGIGIKNVTRRLELLFKDKFNLKTQVKDRKYQVELKIPIQ